MNVFYLANYDSLNVFNDLGLRTKWEERVFSMKTCLDNYFLKTLSFF